MISTTCKDCQFKEMHGKVQTGCSLDIVDLFRDAGTEISTHLDEDRVYFKINGMCMYRRQEWPADKNIHEDVFIRSNIVILHCSLYPVFPYASGWPPVNPEGLFVNMVSPLYALIKVPVPKNSTSPETL